MIWRALAKAPTSLLGAEAAVLADYIPNLRITVLGALHPTRTEPASQISCDLLYDISLFGIWLGR